jgi:thiol-disulfide isomerase/thioredoxin
MRIYLTSLLTVFVFLTGCEPEPDPAESPDPVTRTVSGVAITELEAPMPAFRVATVHGDSLRSSELSGNVVLVNFWATWCAPCIVETPELVGLQEEWKDRPFKIMGVSLDAYADEEVKAFVEDFSVQYPVFVDEIDLAEAFGGAYALPTTYLVDPDGIIRKRWVGLFPFEDARSELDAMISSQESTGSK